MAEKNVSYLQTCVQYGGKYLTDQIPWTDEGDHDFSLVQLTVSTPLAMLNALATVAGRSCPLEIYCIVKFIKS